MRSFSLALLLFFAAWAAALPARGQDQAAPPESQAAPQGAVRVMMNDGTSVVGVIEREDDAEIVLRTSSGVVMTIPRDQVASISEVQGRIYRIDPNRTRLFFTPTARATGRGTGYVAFYEIFVPFVAVGVNDAVTLAGGMTINPGSGRLIYAAPKVTVFDRPTMSFAVGGIGIAGIGDAEDASAGLLFGIGTFGPPRTSLSVGLAFGYAESEFSKKPALMLGGEHQVSNSIKLLTENYIFVGVEDGVAISGGVRFFGDNLAADIGLFTFPALLEDGGSFPFIPWLGFAYNFGR